MKYFRNLTYSLGDEDANVELSLVDKEGACLLGIAGSGARMLPFLSKKPKVLCLIDVSMEQIELSKLRLKTLDRFSYEEYCEFWGYKYISPEKRKALFLSLNIDNSYLLKLFAKNKWKEPIYYGKFEKSLLAISKVMKLLVGKKSLKIFDTKNLEEQVAFYNTAFSKKKFNRVVFLLGNANFLNAILYKGSFPKKNIANSYYYNFKKVFNRIFTETYVRDSYFIQLVLLGKVHYYQTIPEVNEKIFNLSKQNIKECNVMFINGDLGEQSEKIKTKFDYISLSDVPSFLKEEKIDTLLKDMDLLVKDGSKIVYNGFLRQISFLNEYATFSDETHQYKDAIKKDSTKLWKYTILEK